MDSAVGAGDPVGSLGVEIARAGEGPPRQERGLQILIGPLDEAFRLRISRTALNHPQAQRAAERCHRLRELRAPAAPGPNRGLVVPDQRPRRRAPPREQSPVPGQQVRALARGQHAGGHDPRVTRHHHQHRRAADLSGAEWDVDRREPQIALDQLAREILGARGRVRRDEQRAQLSDPVLEHRQRPVPADPLRDHRRRHLRPVGEQLPNLGLHRIDHRPAGGALILRRLVRGQGPAHRVAPDPQPARDRLDRHLLRPMKPTDLRPVLHPQHPSQSARGSRLTRRQGVSFQPSSASGLRSSTP